MKVERYDYAAQFDGEINEVVAEIQQALLAGEYGTDHHVASFESEFADYLGVPSAVGVNSGTDALILAMSALGVGPGDEVILPANTFHATALAVVRCGARPVLVDADPHTFLLDLDRVKSAVTDRTKVILPVHLYGKAVRAAEVAEIARSCGAYVVEDAAQAHGAADRDGILAGTAGDAGCFSFHPSKNLASAGDGGAVVSARPEVIADVRMRRTLGQRSQNDHHVIGLNSRLHALQAIVLRHKLRGLAAANRRRAELAADYRTRLADLPIGLQRVDGDETHVYHLFAIRSTDRDRLLAHLRADGIDAVVRYPVPIHRQPAFAGSDWTGGGYPVAEALSRQLLCLPLQPAMCTAQVDHVADSVRRYFR